jgi:8-oxo-dGTP pyrophosphatase MutT (NUDIX family)
MCFQMTSEPKKHGVVAVLSDGNGRQLYIRRGLTLARAPGYWCFVGGEVEVGESWEVAIEREVREEVGLEIRAIEKVHETISPNGEFRLHWMRVELVRADQEVQPHAHEVAEARWLSMEDALRLEPILPGLKAWLEQQLSQQ